MKKRIISILLVTIFMLFSMVVDIRALPNNSTNKSKQSEPISIIKTDLDKQKNLKLEDSYKGKDVTNIIKDALKEENTRSFIWFNKKSTESELVKNGDFKIQRVEKDKIGNKHVITEMMLDNIPIYANKVILHLDKENKVYSINGKVDDNIKNDNFKNKIKLKREDAIKKVEKDLENKINKDNNYSIEAKLYLYKVNERFQPIYLVKVSSVKPEPSFWHLFVSAENGEIIDKYNALAHGAAPVKVNGINTKGEKRILDGAYEGGAYYLKDLTRPSNGSIMTYDAYNYDRSYYLPGELISNETGIFKDEREKSAVDAHYNISKVYDYYKDKLGRDSFDNKGSSIISSVHFGENFNNAFWNGRQMSFGDGDGELFSSLAASLDITAHEFTHAVTQYTAGLEYRNQQGALNESISDILGIAIENKEGDWLIGEDSYTPNVEGDALRSMKEPTLYDQPDHMKDYLYVSYDHGGVHFNSGIPNKAAYLIGEKLGKEKMAELFYHSLVNYLTPKSNFKDARDGVSLSAIDLYGKDSNEYKIVVNAWNEVGIK